MDNPYAPSHADLDGPFQPGLFQPVPLRGGEIFRQAFRIMADNFWPLSGLGILWYFLLLFAGYSFLGLIAIPHLTGGLSFMGYRFYKRRGNFECLFDGFHKFGPILVAGLIFMGITLAVTVPAVVGILVTIGYLVSKRGAADIGIVTADGTIPGTTVAILSGIAILLILISYLSLYLRARWTLVYSLIAYFDHDVGTAFRHSWRVTAGCGHTLAIQMFLFQTVLPPLGFLLFCVGIAPALGLLIAFHGAVCGLLLDKIYAGTVNDAIPSAVDSSPGILRETRDTAGEAFRQDQNVRVEPPNRSDNPYGP